MKKNVKIPGFSINLLKRLSSSYIVVVVIAIFYVYLMQFVDHTLLWVPYLVVSMALIKTVFFTSFTMRQMNKSIIQCHSFWQLLSVFGSLVFLIIFSFAVDYNCLFTSDPTSFQGLVIPTDLSYVERIFDYFYFSLVTFAAVGYGDVTPTTTPARALVIIEIAQSFIVIVFGLSNIKNIHT